MLSDEEVQTLQTYKKIARKWSIEHSNLEFLKPEFEKFRCLQPSGEVIDVGCGGGRDAALFTQAGYNYTGLDLCQEMIAQAKTFAPNANFLVSSMYALPFSDKTFHGLWASASILHIPKRNLEAVLDELKRICRNGAAAFWAVKEGEGERMEKTANSDDVRFFAYYRPDEFAEKLHSKGFHLLEHEKRAGPKTTWLVYYTKSA